MPSPRITRHKRPKPPLPPRARELCELMTGEGLGLQQCADRMRIKLNTARTYYRLPVFNAYRLQCLAEIRNAEEAKSLHVAIGIRDKSAKKPSAAHGRVAIEAMRYIDGEKAGGVTVNVGVGVSVQPGYLVDVTGHQVGAEQILRRARSSRSLLDATPDAADAVVIDEEAPEPAASPQRREADHLFHGPSHGSAALMNVPSARVPGDQPADGAVKD
jgi:hypothetical protein